MLGKIKDNGQRELFRTRLEDLIDPHHELVLLAKKIEWTYFEEAFSDYYSGNGRPSVPLRSIIGCLILKHLYNISDERLPQEWVCNVYWQYFTGGLFFEHKFPFEPSDFTHFRNRVGEAGIEKIFAYSVKIHGESVDKKSRFVLSDTTVQGNFTTFPTDSKMCKKVIDKCNKIADNEGIKLKRKFIKESKQCLRDIYNPKHPKRGKQAKKSQKRLKTIANIQLRELNRKMSEEQKALYEKDIEPYQRAINQKKTDKDKVYSLHKPFTRCIAKGKPQKQYEFGNRVGLILSGKNRRKKDREKEKLDKRIILAIKGFTENPFDGHTIEPLLNQMENNGIQLPQELVYDRGGKGRQEIRGVKIIIPSPPKKSDSNYEKQKKRIKCCDRAAIEPINRHLKNEFRMEENYLWGEQGVQINALMAGAAWNFKKMMEKLLEELKAKILRFIYRLFFPLNSQPNFYLAA